MVFSSIISHFKKRFVMNLVSIVMQCSLCVFVVVLFCFFFFPIVTEILVLGKRVKQNLKFCENLAHLQILLKKEKLVVICSLQYIFKSFFVLVLLSLQFFCYVCLMFFLLKYLRYGDILHFSFDEKYKICSKLP